MSKLVIAIFISFHLFVSLCAEEMSCLVAATGFRRTKSMSCAPETVGCRVVFQEGKLDHHSDDLKTACLPQLVYKKYYESKPNTCTRARSKKVVRCWCNEKEDCNTWDKMEQIYNDFLDLEKSQPPTESPTLSPPKIHKPNHGSKPMDMKSSKELPYNSPNPKKSWITVKKEVDTKSTPGQIFNSKKRENEMIQNDAQIDSVNKSCVISFSLFTIYIALLVSIVI